MKGRAVSQDWHSITDGTSTFGNARRGIARDRFALRRTLAADPRKLRRTGVRSELNALQFLEGSRGDLLLGGADDGTLHLWDVSGVRPDPKRATWATGHGCLQHVEVSHDRILTGGRDAILKLWTPDRVEPLRKFADHTGWVSCVALDGQITASAGLDSRLLLWHADAKDPIFSIETADAPVALAFLPDSPKMMLVAMPTGWQMLDFRMHKTFRSVVAHGGPKTSAAAAAARQHGGGGGGGTNKTAEDSSHSRIDALDSITLTRSVAPRTGAVKREFDPHHGIYRSVVQGHRAPVEHAGVALGVDGGGVVATTAHDGVKIWDLASGTGVRSLIPDDDAATEEGSCIPAVRPALGLHGQVVVAAAPTKGGICVWDATGAGEDLSARTCAPMAQLQCRTNFGIRAVAVNENLSAIAASDESGGLFIASALG